jgi:uncharacterized protein involved in exopolysaccharide biosynthesis
LSKFSRIPGTALTAALPEPNLAAIPDLVSQQGLSVAQLSAILRAYWKQIAVISITTVIVGAVIIKFLPKTYTATSTLIVNSDVKDPLAGRDFPAEMIANYVSTQIELMTSPIVLQPVIEQLHLMQDKSFTGGSSGSPDAVREAVQKNLAAAIIVERGTGGELLYVSASSKSAANAADIANAVADNYIDQDRRRLNDPANERARRYTEELAELREKASIAQEKVTAFAKDNGIADLTSGSGGIEVQTLDSLHQHLLDTQNYRRSLEANQNPDANSAAATAVRTTRALLDTQLAQLAQLSSTYGPEHPKVKELNAQIAVTRQTLANETQALSANTQAELAQTKQLEQNYLQAIAEQEAKVLKLRQAQAEGSKLLLELESAKAVYKQALDGFDQIMFQAVANHTNVTVVSRAVPPLRASKPNKLKLLLAVFAAAAGLGVGIPLGYGLLIARRLRCRDDIERDFGIAVLAQLEAVSSLSRAT